MAVEYEIHHPHFEGLTTDEWAPPERGDFETDDPTEAADHFLASESGFPPGEFDHLELPVVDADGQLSEQALREVQEGVEHLDAEMEPGAKATAQKLAAILEEQYFERPEGVREAQQEARRERYEERVENLIGTTERYVRAREQVNPDLHAEENPYDD